MKNAFKIVVKLLGLIVVLFIIVLLFPAKEEKYRCASSGSGSKTEIPIMFVKLIQYRWWVELWSDSDGAVNIEVPNTEYGYFDKVVKSGDQLIISNSSDVTLGGVFSTFSKSLLLNTRVGQFKGLCHEI